MVCCAEITSAGVHINNEIRYNEYFIDTILDFPAPGVFIVNSFS